MIALMSTLAQATQPHVQDSPQPEPPFTPVDVVWGSGCCGVAALVLLCLALFVFGWARRRRM